MVRSKPEDKVVDLDLKHTIEDWVMTKKRSTKFWLKVGLNRCTYPWKRIRSDDYSSNSVTEVSSVKMEVAVKMILHVSYGCSLLRKDGLLEVASSLGQTQLVRLKGQSRIQDGHEGDHEGVH